MEVKTAEPETIRVVIFREKTRDGDRYVGQCLEYDHGSQDETIGGLVSRIELGLAAEFEILKKNGLRNSTFLTPAPARFQEMWIRSQISLNRPLPAPPPGGAAFRLDLALAEGT